jgi:hypothetical protein
LIEESETAVDTDDTGKYITTVKKLVNGKWKKTMTVERRQTQDNK